MFTGLPASTSASTDDSSEDFRGTERGRQRDSAREPIAFTSLTSFPRFEANII